MDTEKILTAIINIHNELMMVSVHGEDTIKMAGIIQSCRSLLSELTNDINKNENNSIEIE